MRLFRIAAVLASLTTSPSLAQEPDRRGEVVLDRPEYRGVVANAPIPPKNHVRNEGGSDGAGLCVISSVLCNGMYQGVPGLEGGKNSRLWRTAKARPGGYSPDKLAALIDEVLPGEGYASYVGLDTRVLDRLSAKRYPVGITMNTGSLYQYRPIHHMVSLAHFSKRDGTACVVDNNRPGWYSWMPVGECDRRWVDGNVGWAVVWTRKAVALGLELACALFAAAPVFAGAGWARRRGLV
jgi:hypothetical protein